LGNEKHRPAPLWHFYDFGILIPTYLLTYVLTYLVIAAVLSLDDMSVLSKQLSEQLKKWSVLTKSNIYIRSILSFGLNNSFTTLFFCYAY